MLKALKLVAYVRAVQWWLHAGTIATDCNHDYAINCILCILSSF